MEQGRINNDACLKRKKTRRGKKVQNRMKMFTVYYNNIRGLKGKEESLKDYVKEIEPTIICLTETHLAEEDEWKMDGYKTVPNNRNVEGGGILIAVKDEVANITKLSSKQSKIGETLWICVDNQRITLRVGLIYAPQESRTKKAALKTMYKDIEKEIVLARNEDQHLLIMGDFNSCKVGKEIVANPSGKVSKAGEFFLNLTKDNDLHIVNNDKKCIGTITRKQGKEESILDYILINANDRKGIESLKIDEERLWTPYYHKKKKDGIQTCYTDHNAMILKMNWVLLHQQIPENEKYIKWGKISAENFKRVTSGNMLTETFHKGGSVQDKYTRWSNRVLSQAKMIYEKDKRKRKVKENKKIKSLRKIRKMYVKQRCKEKCKERIRLMTSQIKWIDEYIYSIYNKKDKAK